jgi:hypothetical protein
MSSAEGSDQQTLLQRVSTPLFLLLSLLLVPAATFVFVTLVVIVCVIAGVENSELQARISLAALLIGFAGSIYLLIRARRSPPSQRQQARVTPSALPPLPTASGMQEEIHRSEMPAEADRYKPSAELMEARDAIMSSISDDDGIDEGVQSDGSPGARMVDWLQSWKAPILIGGVVFVAGIALFQGNGPAIGRMVWLAAFVGIWTLFVQLRGLYFDRAADSLSYPMLFFRRSISLSKIDDANCQTKMGTDDPLNFAIKLLGHTPTDKSESKRYIVNISGEFGARRVIFHSKYKRDQFLSLLRSFAPQARITRWS